MSVSGSGSTASPVIPATPTPPATPPATPVAIPTPFATNSVFAPSPAFAAVADGSRTLAAGERGVHVRTLEQALLDLGYALPGAAIPDLRMTRATESLVSRFQRDQGIPQTGHVDAATLAALDRALAARAVSSTAATDPLAGKLFMEKSTFAGAAPAGWARDNIELEGLYGVAGIEGDQLLDILRADRGGRDNFSRLRKNRDMEAFSSGYAIDEMPWDANSHRARESNPNVWLTIESDRYAPNPETGEREISLGTDIMDDVYYDTEDFTLLDNDVSLRTRVRWDSDTEVRRLLIGAKFGSGLDESGLKSCAKIDVRTGSATPDEVKGLDAAIRVGKASWEDGPTQPAREAYERLAAKGVLPDVGGHEDVLLLEPKAMLRSIRSRYHLEESTREDVERIYTTGGKAHLEALGTAIQAAKTAGTIPAANTAAVDAFAAKTNGALDGTLIADRARDALKAIDPAMDVTAASIEALLPKGGSSWSRPALTSQDLEKRRVVADTVNAVYHELADELGDLRRVITGSSDQALEPHAGFFMAFEKSKSQGDLGKVRTFDRFATIHADLMKRPEADVKAALEAYNRWGSDQRAAGNDPLGDFEPLTIEQFRAVLPQLENEKLRIWTRQLEAAGSAARGLWFDDARAHYVPESSRNTGNFLIDTTDMTMMVKPEDWAAIPEADRSPSKPIPADKVFHTTLVNEVQIELGSEEAYVKRLDALKGEIGTDRASLVMKWLDSVNHPGLGGQHDTAAYTRTLDGLRALPEADLQGTVDALNAFLKAQGSALTPLTAADVKAIDNPKLTPETRDKEVRKERTTERNLEGATFVFDEYRGMLKSVSAMKEERVLSTLRRAGAPRNITWTEPSASKGDIALTKLRDGQP